MDTTIHPDNPLGHSRHGFAWEHVPATSTRHLDFGCYRGHLLDALRRKGVVEVVGVDASSDAIDEGKRLYPQVVLHHLPANANLPFEDKSFTSITLLDVLEHVADQKALLDELHRVLTDDGMLIVTVPKQHLFSFLDMGNLKFRFPTLHRWFFCLRHSRKEYEYRYISNPDGLVGDVSAEKRWHEHFTPKHLANVLGASDFEPTRFDGSGLCTRPLMPLLMTLGKIPGLKSLFKALLDLDARWFKSMNLFCVAEKQPAARTRET